MNASVAIALILQEARGRDERWREYMFPLRPRTMRPSHSFYAISWWTATI